MYFMDPKMEKYTVAKNENKWTDKQRNKKKLYIRYKYFF